LYCFFIHELPELVIDKASTKMSGFSYEFEVRLVPYFEVDEGKLEEFKSLWAARITDVMNEPLNVTYTFSFCGHKAHCIETYKNAEGVLAHLANVGDTLGQALQISKLVRLEVHGVAGEVS
jgi:hypothetical protein